MNSYVRFSVDKDVKVRMTSSVSAAYKQRFQIRREHPNDSIQTEPMGKEFFNGGEFQSFSQISDRTYWRVECQNDGGNSNWRDSRMQLTGEGTPQVVIRCDDDTSGDNDFNDLIVAFYFSENGSFSKEISAQFPNDIPEAHGSGVFTKDLHKDPPDNPGKGKIPH